MSSDHETIPRDYLVKPEVGRGPGVLVLHSGRGLTGFVRSFCAKLSREGFVALAPDVFAGETPTTVEEARELKESRDPDALRRRLEDASEFLRKNEAVSRDAIAVVGLGYGAELACDLSAALHSDCAGVVLFYGHRPTDWSGMEAPILGHFAQLDQELSESRIADIRATLDEHGVEHDLFVYPGTEPSFFETDETARHDPEAARLAWERTAHFLRAVFE